MNCAGGQVRVVARWNGGDDNGDGENATTPHLIGVIVAEGDRGQRPAEGLGPQIHGDQVCRYFEQPIQFGLPLVKHLVDGLFANKAGEYADHVTSYLC